MNWIEADERNGKSIENSRGGNPVEGERQIKERKCSETELRSGGDGTGSTARVGQPRRRVRL